MSNSDIQKENALQSPIPQFSHDPNFIAFRSWTTILSLEGALPVENPADSNILFLDENAKNSEMEMLPVRGPVCLRNPTRFTQLNVTIVSSQSGRQVFFVRELPGGRFLHLEFLQEGSYTLHYSPAFTPFTLHRQIRVFTPVSRQHSVPHNFHPQLQIRLQTRRAGLNFNAPFPEYNEPKSLLGSKDRLPTLNKEETGEYKKENP
jgi:hypothetical protein